MCAPTGTARLIDTFHSTGSNGSHVGNCHAHSVVHQETRSCMRLQGRSSFKCGSMGTHRRSRHCAQVGVMDWPLGDIGPNHSPLAMDRGGGEVGPVGAIIQIVCNRHTGEWPCLNCLHICFPVPVPVTVRFQKMSRSGDHTGGKGKQQQATNPLMGLGLPMCGVAYRDLVFLPSSCS